MTTVRVVAHPWLLASRDTVKVNGIHDVPDVGMLTSIFTLLLYGNNLRGEPLNPTCRSGIVSHNDLVRMGRDPSMSVTVFCR